MPHQGDYSHGPSKKEPDSKQHVKTRAQVAYLLSDKSPLTDEQKETLREEIERGAVKVRG